MSFMSKRDPEAAYYKGKIDSKQERPGFLSELIHGTNYRPSGDETEREMYDKGWKDGKQGK